MACRGGSCRRGGGPRGARAVGAGALAACASASAANTVPSIEPAKITHLADFQPAAPVAANTPAKISFTIRQPNEAPLTAFKTGSGPHTGVHIIPVAKSLETLNHQHKLPAGDGKISIPITFPAPGRYRGVVDVYPKSGEPKNY